MLLEKINMSHHFSFRWGNVLRMNNRKKIFLNENSHVSEFSLNENKILNINHNRNMSLKKLKYPNISISLRDLSIFLRHISIVVYFKEIWFKLAKLSKKNPPQLSTINFIFRQLNFNQYQSTEMTEMNSGNGPNNCCEQNT